MPLTKLLKYIFWDLRSFKSFISIVFMSVLCLCVGVSVSKSNILKKNNCCLSPRSSASSKFFVVVVDAVAVVAVVVIVYKADGENLTWQLIRVSDGHFSPHIKSKNTVNCRYTSEIHPNIRNQ